MPKVHFNKVEEFVNYETKEVLTKETKYYKHVIKEPSFIKLYLDDIGRLNSLQPRTVAILRELLKRVDYSNRVNISLGVKKDICTTLSILNKSGTVAVNVFSQHLSKLSEASLLFKIETGSYIINPKLFAKGDWMNIKKIVLMVSYDVNGREVFAKSKQEKKPKTNK